MGVKRPLCIYSGEVRELSGEDIVPSSVYGSMDLRFQGLPYLDTSSPDYPHLHYAATTSVAGFMSATDKTKLDGILAASISDGDTTHAPDGNSVFDALALKANVSDASFTGTHNYSNAGLSAAAWYTVKRDAGYAAGVAIATGNLNRWTIRANNTAETGSDAGSNFQIDAYDDAGAWKEACIIINRVTGIATFSDTPIFPTPAAGDNTTKGATTAFVTAGFAPKVDPIFSGELTLIADTGDDAWINISREAGEYGGIFFKTGTSRRWVLFCSNAAEAGSNAGSNLHLQVYDDSGTALGTAFTILRSSMVMTFNYSPLLPTPAAGDNTTKGATTAFVKETIASSITDGDTTHSPDGNSVFDALALKANLAGPTFTGTTTVAKLVNTGFSTLGDAAPVIKMKKLTGTTNAAEGGLTNVAHGLTSSKIIGVSVIIWTSAGVGETPGYTNSAEYFCDWWFDATNFKIQNHATNSGSILSKPFTVLLTYEE